MTNRFVRNILSLVILLAFFSGINSQNLNLDLSIVAYNTEFENCEVEYDSLYRINSGQLNLTAKFLLDKRPFTGCAKTTMHGETEKSNEYFISYFKDGYPTKQIYYFNNGNLSREFNFKNGKSDGRHVMYYEDGSKYIEEFYEKGKTIGAQKRWHANGKIWRTAYYSNGIRVFDKMYDKDGKEIKNIGC